MSKPWGFFDGEANGICVSVGLEGISIYLKIVGIVSMLDSRKEAIILMNLALIVFY